MFNLTEWVRRRMLYSSRAERIQLERLRENRPGLTLVKIAPGIYLDTTDIRPDTKPWELRKLVTIARAFAVKMHFSPDHPVMFTGETAGVIQGLDTWWNNPNIAFRADVRRRRKRSLPKVKIGGITVPAVYAYHVTGGVEAKFEDCSNVGGLLVAAPQVMIADAARREHPLQAFVLACSILRQLSKFSTRQAQRARREANRYRQEWLQLAATIEGKRACRVFQHILNGMEAGIDSPLESAALWAIKCLIPQRKRGSVTTQELVHTPIGSHYFVDLAFPELKAGLETDGRGKYGNDAEQVDAYAANHTNRHQNITDAGWTLRHVTSKEIGMPNMVMIMHGHLQMLGVLPKNQEPRPTSPLYRAASPELHQRRRRF